MSFKRSFGKIASAFFVCLALITLSLAQTPPPPPPGLILPAELDQAKKYIQTFCADWKKLKFDSMYVMMSEATQANTPKAKFINTYGVMSDNSGRLSSFAVKEALPNDDGIIVKAELTFVKQNPPTAANGVHNFHLVKENGKWKVETIVPPIAAPEVNGSGGHPGE